MADINNNTRRRGRPKGSKNKNKQPQHNKNLNSSQSYTLESLRDKKKRSLSHDARRESVGSVISANNSSKKVPSSPPSDSSRNPGPRGLPLVTSTPTSTPSPASPVSQVPSVGHGLAPKGSGLASPPAHSETTISPLPQDAGAILQQLVNRFSGKLNKQQILG